jgi:hypothetical protein
MKLKIGLFCLKINLKLKNQKKLLKTRKRIGQELDNIIFSNCISELLDKKSKKW